MKDKDKEKQIEVKKLVNIITKIYPNKYSIEYPAKAIRLADELLEHYQPKLSEDSVVISKAKYELLVECSSYEGVMKALKNEYNKGSKETAEKIIDLIKTFCPDKKFVEVITRIIAERFGVEIKEN